MFAEEAVEKIEEKVEEKVEPPKKKRRLSPNKSKGQSTASQESQDKNKSKKTPQPVKESEASDKPPAKLKRKNAFVVEDDSQVSVDSLPLNKSCGVTGSQVAPLKKKLKKSVLFFCDLLCLRYSLSAYTCLWYVLCYRV